MLKWMIYDYPPHLRKRPNMSTSGYVSAKQQHVVRAMSSPSCSWFSYMGYTYWHYAHLHYFSLDEQLWKEFQITINRLKGSCFQQDRQFIIPGHFDDSLLCCLLFPCLSFLEPRCIRKLAQCSHLPGTSQLYCTATSVFPSGGARHGARWSGPTISRYRKMTFADVSLDELTSQAVRPRSHGYWESGEQIWHKLA